MEGFRILPEKGPRVCCNGARICRHLIEALKRENLNQRGKKRVIGQS